MNSTNRHEHDRQPAGRFAILAIGDNEAALCAPTLGNADFRRVSGGPGYAHAAQMQLYALNEGYDAVFIAGFGAGADDALRLAARFPDLVHGVVLFTPQLRQTNLSRRLVEAGLAFNAAIQRLVQGVAQRLGQSMTPCTGLDFQSAHPSAAASHLSLREIHQPVLIFHPRAGSNADIKAAATFQHHLGGPVEVQFVGPGADVEVMSPLNPALVQRCSNFSARVAAGAEGRRAKRQQAAERSAATAASAKSSKSAVIRHSTGNSARFAETLAQTPPNAIA